LPAFYLKSEERGNTDCLAIQRSTVQPKQGTNIAWFACDSTKDQIALQWVLLPTKIFKKNDPEFGNQPHHICQLYQGRSQCLTISHPEDSPNEQNPAVPYLTSHLPKEKVQIWKKNIKGTGPVVSIDKGFCLEYSEGKSLFATNKCDDLGINKGGNLSKSLNWYFVPILNETGGQKCVSNLILNRWSIVHIPEN